MFGSQAPGECRDPVPVVVLHYGKILPFRESVSDDTIVLQHIDKTPVFLDNNVISRSPFDRWYPAATCFSLP